MRISDWSSDVCSSDVGERLARLIAPLPAERQRAVAVRQPDDALIFGIAVETLEHRVEVGARLESIGAETVEVGEGEVRRDTAAAERGSEEHTSELQSLMRISYAVFCLKKKKT